MFAELQTLLGFLPEEIRTSKWRMYRWKRCVCLPTGFGKSLCFIMLPDSIRVPYDPSIIVAI